MNYRLANIGPVIIGPVLVTTKSLHTKSILLDMLLVLVFNIVKSNSTSHAINRAQIVR